MEKFKVVPAWDMPEEEWLEFRKNGIGGSDAGTIIGVNKYNSAYALWAERVGLVEREFTGNDATDWGNELELPTARMYAKKHNKAVVEWPVILVSEENPFMFANLDFLLVEPSEEFRAGTVTTWRFNYAPPNVLGILEVKTTGIASPGTPHLWRNGGIPLGYQLQTIHYGIVTGWHDNITFAALVAGEGLQVRHLEWDEEIAENLVIAEQQFWDLVISKTPPPVDGSEATESAQQSMYGRHEPGKGYEGGSALMELWQEFEAAKREADEADARRKALRARVIELVGNSEYATVNGDVILTYRTSKDSEVLDTDRFKREAPEIFELYKKTRPGARVLRGTNN